MRLIILLFLTLFSVSVQAIDKNESIDKWVKEYSENRRTHFQLSINRSGLYLPIAIDIFSNYEIPKEFIWIPFVEAGYDCTRKSDKGAAGCWQFIRGTGKEFELRKNIWKDDRYDFYKSTKAAAEYLSFLYKRFGSLNLVLAAYNCGPTKVRAAVTEKGTEDFWSLDLPEETKDYLPKFHAALIILSDIDKYGFTLSESEIKTVVLIPGPHSLKYISNRLLSVDHSEFLKLNPGFDIGYTPPGEYTVIYLKKDWDIALLRGFGLIAKKKALNLY